MDSEEEDASNGGADGGVGGGLGRSASVDPPWSLAWNSSSRMMATILSWFSSLSYVKMAVEMKHFLFNRSCCKLQPICSYLAMSRGVLPSWFSLAVSAPLLSRMEAMSV